MPTYPTYGYNRVKEFQNNWMTSEAVPRVSNLMRFFFPILYDLLRRIVHVMKRFSKECYPTNPRCSERFHWIAMNLFTEFFPINDGYRLSCQHLGLMQHDFESYELIVRAFMYMMSAMPSEFVIEVFYFIENTLFEPSFERFWKLKRSEDRAREFDEIRLWSSLTFNEKYAAINALETVHCKWRHFVTNLYRVPRQILCIKLIWRNNYFIKFISRQRFSNIANITFQKRLKTLLMSGMLNKLVIRLFYSREIFPLSSQLNQIYSKNFGEVMHNSICCKMKAPKEVPRLELQKITTSHFSEAIQTRKHQSFLNLPKGT